MTQLRNNVFISIWRHRITINKFAELSKRLNRTTLPVTGHFGHKTLRHQFCGADVSCGRSVRLPLFRLLEYGRCELDTDDD